MKRSALYLILILSGVASRNALGQDAHYWSNQYGTRAQLLGGLVVGSIKDLSGTFYNPGAIALTNDLSLEVSTEAIQFTDIKQPDGAGKGIDLQSFKVDRSPGIVAARIKIGKRNQHQLAFSIITRYDTDFEVDARRIDPYEDIANDLNAFAGEILFEKRMKEIWLGFSWAYKFGKRIGFGVTQYIPVHSQRHRFQTLGQAVTPGGDGAAIILVNERKFYNLRLLWKSGVVIDYSPLIFGITVTTPSLNLFGNGSFLVNGFTDVTEPDSGGMPNAVLISNYQKDLDARLISPFSIAGGISYNFGRTAVHFSIERFTQLNQFTVMKPAPFQVQSSGQVVDREIKHALRAVTNYGIGLQYSLKDPTTLYGAFRRDFSAWDSDAPSDITLANWDINHITIGTVSSYKSLDFTLGLGYSFGDDLWERLVDFIGIDRGSDLINDSEIDKVRFRRLKIIVGASFSFGDR